MSASNDYQRIHAGFVLGIAIAEQLNDLPQNCTISNESFLDTLREIASGSITLVESGSELDLPPESASPEVERKAAQAAMQDAARTILLLCNPDF